MRARCGLHQRPKIIVHFLLNTTVNWLFNSREANGVLRRPRARAKHSRRRLELPLVAVAAEILPNRLARLPCHLQEVTHRRVELLCQLRRESLQPPVAQKQRNVSLDQSLWQQLAWLSQQLIKPPQTFSSLRSISRTLCSEMFGRFDSSCAADLARPLVSRFRPLTQCKSPF